MVGKGTITMRETRILEFKETITNAFLKTVSAFSNYNGGTILFGVDDNGNVKGLQDQTICEQFRLVLVCWTASIPSQ